MKKVVIFGTAEIAKLACCYFRDDSDYEVVAFTVDSRYRESETLLGVPVVAAETLTTTHPPADFEVFIGMAYSNGNRGRAAVYRRVKELGYRCATYVSSKASVVNAQLGENVWILSNVSIQPFVTLGNNVVVASNAVICHDCRIGDHCYIGPHACLCGYNDVGECTIIGTSATLAPRVCLGKSNFIGLGANMFNSTGDDEAYLVPGTTKSPLSATQVARLESMTRSVER